MQKFSYKKRKSDIFGEVKRPIISLEVYSPVLNRWILIDNVLADTGADISLIPKTLGSSVVGDITKGKEVKLRGIVPFARLVGFIHKLKLKLGGKEFKAPVVIVDSDYAHPIFGRIDALDRFLAEFDKGKETILK